MSPSASHSRGGDGTQGDSRSLGPLSPKGRWQDSEPGRQGVEGVAYLFVPQDLEKVAGGEAPRLQQQLPCLLQARPSQHQQLVGGRVQQKVPELREGESVKGPVLCSDTVSTPLWGGPHTQPAYNHPTPVPTPWPGQCSTRSWKGCLWAFCWALPKTHKDGL